MEIEEKKKRLRDMSAELCVNVFDYTNARITSEGIRTDVCGDMLMGLAAFVDTQTKVIDDDPPTDQQMLRYERTLQAVNRHINPKESRQDNGSMLFHALEASMIAYRLVSPHATRQGLMTKEGRLYDQARQAFLKPGFIGNPENDISVLQLCHMGYSVRESFNTSSRYILEKGYIGQEQNVSQAVDLELCKQVRSIDRMLATLVLDGYKQGSSIRHKLKQAYLMGSVIHAMDCFANDAGIVPVSERMFPIQQTASALKTIVPR